MSDYTLKQLEGSIKCDWCGSKYWETSAVSPRLFCAGCGHQSPRKPEVTKTRVRSDFKYARSVMSDISSALSMIGRNDDPRLGVSIDLEYLAQLANDLQGAVATFSEYVSERGGQL
jgi:hypothetical protein